jgi:hypothetical protein
MCEHRKRSERTLNAIAQRAELVARINESHEATTAGLPAMRRLTAATSPQSRSHCVAERTRSANASGVALIHARGCNPRSWARDRGILSFMDG